MDWPTTMNKKSLTLCFCSPDRPSSTTVCCVAVNWTFVNKNQLLHLVLPDPSDVFEALLCWLFCCNACDLGRMYISYHTSDEFILTFFIVNPALWSARQTVECETSTPQDVTNIPAARQDTSLESFGYCLARTIKLSLFVVPQTG